MGSTKNTITGSFCVFFLEAGHLIILGGKQTKMLKTLCKIFEMRHRYDTSYTGLIELTIIRNK